jgi:hypothetical protein
MVSVLLGPRAENGHAREPSTCSFFDSGIIEELGVIAAGIFAKDLNRTQRGGWVLPAPFAAIRAIGSVSVALDNNPKNGMMI